MRIQRPTITAPTITQVQSLAGTGANITGSFQGDFDGTLTGATFDTLAPKASPTFTGTVSGITSTMVGLGNVDNTADADKPVSTAQQTEIDTKADIASPTFTGTVSGISSTMVGLGNVDNTSDANKPVSTAQQTEIDTKADIASPTFTGTPISTTPTANDNSTKIATTAYVQQELTDLVGGAPAAYDTLLEISASIANGDSDVVALTTTVGGKLQKDQNLSDLTDAATGRTNLGVDAAGTDNSTDVTLSGSYDYLTLSGQEITLGTIDTAHIADDAVTVAKIADASLTTLSEGIGNPSNQVDTQIPTTAAVADHVSTLGGLFADDGNFVVGDGNVFVVESGATARTSMGVGTGDDVQFDSFGVGTAASGTQGEIRATGDITAYYSSDQRLKENFAPLTGALDKVKAIGGYEFDWKDGIEDVVSKTGHDIGVKAQEIQLHYPELVHTRDNGYLAVDYIKLNAVLIEAVKELAAKVDELSK